MSPDWRRPLNKLLQKSQSLLHPTNSATKSSLSLTTSLSEGQSGMTTIMTTEPEHSMHPETLTPPRIFALVVAIDRYKSTEFPNLTGCKNDGKRFIDFLVGVLGIPSSQIVFLADEEATEKEIFKQFNQFLIENVNIQQDDAIVFFYAGHGCRLDAPPGWVTGNNKIEILCPHDVQTIDVDGNELWGISDRAIDVLMRRLASEKGDNILVVFDCCHSGGLARAHENGLRIRCIPPPPHPPPTDLNREIWESVPEQGTRAAHTVIQTGFQYKAMESHVLLAACRPDEAALEDPSAKDAPGGLFTIALIESLRRYSVHDTSYARLFEMLDLKYKVQHPQCEGKNRDRLLFSVNTLHHGETTFKVSEKGGKIIISAGSIHGVVVDTEFSVTTATENVVLKAKKVGAFESMLERTHHDITSARGKVSHWHHPTLRVHSSIHYSSAHISVVPDDEPAEVTLLQDESGKWELERFDPLITAYSDRFIRFDADATRMKDILDAIANFNSYLYRLDGAAASFSGKVKIRMNRIGFIRNEINPVGRDLLEVPRSSHSGINVKEATITDLNSRYSFTLENTSEVDLFPYLFYFDPSDYSVETWYKPPSSTMNAPLGRKKADGTPSLFAFGYGGFGTNPVEFYLPPGCKRDSGFLKVFLTTTYVDMTSVAQSPISEVHGSRGLRYTLKGTWTCETFVLTCEKP